MINRYRYLFLITLLFTFHNLWAQSIEINNFIVKENLLKNDKLAIIAADANDNPIDSINGVFQFSLNGFQKEMSFHEGVAITPDKIDKSTFIYVKHQNDVGTHSKLYYVIKKEDGLNPLKISWAILVIIPLILIFLGMMFKRFIMIAAVLIIGMIFFNQNKGLHLGTFFETIFDGLKGLF